MQSQSLTLFSTTLFYTHTRAQRFGSVDGLTCYTPLTVTTT